MLLCFHIFLTDNDGQVAMLHDKSILLMLAQCPSILHLSDLGFKFFLIFFALPFLTFNFGFIYLLLSSGDTFPLSLWIWHKEEAFPNDNKTVFSWEVSAQREIC